MASNKKVTSKRPVVNEKPRTIRDTEDITQIIQDKSLIELRDFINSRIEKYGEKSHLDYEYFGYDGGFDINIEYFRQETEEETALRVSKEKKEQEKFDKKEKSEYEEFLRLKDKF